MMVRRGRLLHDHGPGLASIPQNTRQNGRRLIRCLSASTGCEKHRFSSLLSLAPRNAAPPCSACSVARHAICHIVIFSLRVGLGGVRLGHTNMTQDAAVAERQEFIQLRDPVVHGQGLGVHRMKFGEFQISRHDPVESLYFILEKIVLRDRYIRLLRRATLGLVRPSGEPDMILGCADVGGNHRGGGMAMRRPVHLVCTVWRKSWVASADRR